MEWIEIKTTEDIVILQQTYNDFMDSTLVSYRFESGNYVDADRVGYEYNLNDPYAPIGGDFSDRSEIIFAKVTKKHNRLNGGL